MIMYEWLASKIADWLYDIMVRHIEKKFRRRHKASTWLQLARRIAKRYEESDYDI